MFAEYSIKVHAEYFQDKTELNKRSTWSIIELALSRLQDQRTHHLATSEAITLVQFESVL